MNEAAQLQAPASEHDFWDIVRRTLAAIVILLALMALVVNHTDYDVSFLRASDAVIGGDDAQTLCGEPDR